jgi:hypothetical protein
MIWKVNNIDIIYSDIGVIEIKNDGFHENNVIPLLRFDGVLISPE